MFMFIWHLSFAKSLSLLLFFVIFWVRDSLQWVLMSFSVCSARFLVRSGGFQLWFLRKISTPTFVRNKAIEQVIKFFACENLIVKVC